MEMNEEMKWDGRGGAVRGGPSIRIRGSTLETRRV